MRNIRSRRTRANVKKWISSPVNLAQRSSPERSLQAWRHSSNLNRLKLAFGFTEGDRWTFSTRISQSLSRSSFRRSFKSSCWSIFTRQIKLANHNLITITGRIGHYVGVLNFVHRSQTILANVSEGSMKNEEYCIIKYHIIEARDDIASVCGVRKTLPFREVPGRILGTRPSRANSRNRVERSGFVEFSEFGGGH